jgi:hypothetical protein
VEGLLGVAASGLEDFLPFFWASPALPVFVRFAEGNVFSPAQIFRLTAIKRKKLAQNPGACTGNGEMEAV